MSQRKENFDDAFKDGSDIILLGDTLSPRQYVLKTRWEQFCSHKYPFECHLKLYLLIHRESSRNRRKYLLDCLFHLFEDYLHDLLVLSQHSRMNLVVISSMEVLDEGSPGTDRHACLV